MLFIPAIKFGGLLQSNFSFNGFQTVFQTMPVCLEHNIWHSPSSFCRKNCKLLLFSKFLLSLIPELPIVDHASENR